MSIDRDKLQVKYILKRPGIDRFMFIDRDKLQDKYIFKRPGIDRFTEYIDRGKLQVNIYLNVQV